jgi:hypothetical protein
LPIVFPNYVGIDDRIQPWVLSSIGFHRLIELKTPRAQFSRLEAIIEFKFGPGDGDYARRITGHMDLSAGKRSKYVASFETMGRVHALSRG